MDRNTKQQTKTTDTSDLMSDWFMLGQLVDNHYQIQGYKNREDFDARKGSKQR